MNNFEFDSMFCNEVKMQSLLNLMGLNKKSIWMSLALILMTTSPVQAKDLLHRLGIGFQNRTVLDLPSVSMIYFPAKDFSVLGSLGADSENGYSYSQALVGARFIIYPEMNMNFYSTGTIALLNTEDPVNGKNSGVEFSGGFGVEFFFAGLENLGFTFEAGAGYSTLNHARFRTLGLDPLHAGMIFYF